MKEKNVTPIEKLILEKESDTVGGMVVCIWGEQGAQKTMTLTRMVMMDMGVEEPGDSFDTEEVNRIPVWKGQRSCQWILLAANNLPVTLWMHESIEDYEFYLTGSRKNGLKTRKIDPREMEGLDVEIETYETQEELVDNLKSDRVNVYYIPGARGSEKDRYFYQFQNYKLDEALNQRRYGDHVTLNRDEIQNEASTMRKGDFYSLQEYKFPGEWEDFRKNKVSMRGTGHSHNEVNYKLHKNKVTGTVYMKAAQVHSRHRQIDQSKVNSMNRGDFVIPGDGFQPGEIEMPRLPHQVFPWMPDNSDIRFEMDFEADIPDVRPKKKEVDDWIDDRPFTKDEIQDLISLGDAVELTSLGKTALKQRIYNGDVKAVKVENKHWLLSATQLISNSEVPIED